jgi:hypothetical protein
MIQVPRLEKDAKTGHVGKMNSRQYLELMGIDVWQRRPPRSAKPEPVVALELDQHAVVAGSNIDRVRQSLGHAAETAAPSKLAPAPTMPVPIVASGPSFLLAFADFPGMTAASLYSADLARLPDHHQHFLSSLYFALSGKKSAVKVTDFRWPLVKSKHISQSQEEAKQVLEQSLGRLGEHVIAFGQNAAELLAPDVVTDYETTVMTGKAAGKTLWVLPELEHFFSQPLERKKLWHWLGGLREALKGE